MHGILGMPTQILNEISNEVLNEISNEVVKYEQLVSKCFNQIIEVFHQT